MNERKRIEIAMEHVRQARALLWEAGNRKHAVMAAHLALDIADMLEEMIPDDQDNGPGREPFPADDLAADNARINEGLSK